MFMKTILYGRPQIDINPGFMSQLHEYYAELHPPQLSQQDFPSTPPENVRAPDLVVDSEDWMLQSLTVDIQKQAMYQYACKICRSVVFHDLDIVEHERGGGKESFKWHKQDAGIASAPGCTSYFLDEMPWMGTCKGTEGKLFCPKCKGKIGSWVWNGTQCSCGAWCVPAFQVHKARVDSLKID